MPEIAAADTAGSPLSEAMTAFMKCYEESWAARDMESLLSPLRPDCSVLYPPMEEETDRQGLRDFYDQAYAIMSDFTVRPVCWAASGEYLLVQWDASGTIDGQSVTWSGSDRFRFDDEGRVVEARAYYDPRRLLEVVAASVGEVPAV